MGAFENAIREAETLDSLLDLYREAQVEITHLRAEVRELRKDRDRLDRIESLAGGGRYGWSGSGEHRFVLPHLVHRSQSPRFNSFRESIDSAMAAEREGEK